MSPLSPCVHSSYCESPIQIHIQILSFIPAPPTWSLPSKQLETAPSTPMPILWNRWKTPSYQLSAVNSTSFEYWQFEAVSTDGTQGLALYFFRDSSFVQRGQGNLFLELMAVWGDGTLFNTTIFVNESSIEVCDRYTTGKWSSPGTHLIFKIPKSLNKAEIALFSPQVSGNFSLSSKAPAHYPDGALYPSTNASVSLAPFLFVVDSFLVFYLT